MRVLHRSRTAAAILVWVAGVGCVAYGWLNAEDGVWSALALGLGGLASGAVGLVLAVRTQLTIGWLFLGAQILMGLTSAFGSAAAYALMILVSAILLLFPSGRLPSQRWVWAEVVLVVGAASWLALEVLGLVEDEELSENLTWAIAFVSSTLVLVSSAIRVVNDYRRSRGQTRQQLKPLALVLIVGGLLLFLSVFGFPVLADANQLAGVVLFVGSPIAIGVAVTRYRLYEIDRIVSRTVSYALVVAVLAGGVALVAALVGSRFDSPLIVAATTLGVAAAFNPLRRRVQSWVDRRFNRARYDHERVAQDFTASLRDGVDFDQVVQGWVGVVSSTMHPSSIGVWTKSG